MQVHLHTHSLPQASNVQASVHAVRPAQHCPLAPTSMRSLSHLCPPSAVAPPRHTVQLSILATSSHVGSAAGSRRGSRACITQARRRSVSPEAEAGSQAPQPAQPPQQPGSSAAGSHSQQSAAALALDLSPLPDDDDDGVHAGVEVGEHEALSGRGTHAVSEERGSADLFRSLASDDDRIILGKVKPTHSPATEAAQAHAPPASGQPHRTPPPRGRAPPPSDAPPARSGGAGQQGAGTTAGAHEHGQIRRKQRGGARKREWVQSQLARIKGRSSAQGAWGPQQQSTGGEGRGEQQEGRDDDVQQLKRQYQAMKRELEALKGAMGRGGNHRTGQGWPREQQGAPRGAWSGQEGAWRQEQEQRRERWRERAGADSRGGRNSTYTGAAGAAAAAAGGAAAARAGAAGQAQRGGGAEERPPPRVQLPRLAIARPLPERVGSDSTFLEELRRKMQAMSPTTQSALQVAADNLQAHCDGLRAQLEGRGSSDGAQHRWQADQQGETAEQGEHMGYSSEVEVVSDAMEIVLGFRLPEKAFYGSRARTLTQLDLNDVKLQCKKWRAMVGLDYARLFLAKEPRLLAQDPVILLQQLEVFASSLYLSPEEAMDFAVRNSALINQGLTKEQVQGAVRELASLLDEPEVVAAKMLTRCTLLLTLPHGSISARFEALAALLPVTRLRLVAACKRRPLLLLGSVQRLSANLVELANMLEIPLSSAAVVIAAVPGILGSQPARLVAKWHSLCELGSAFQPWRRQMAEWGEGAVGRCLTVTEDALLRPRYILRHGMQVLPEAQDLKRLLTMSTGAFKRTFVDPYPPQRVHGRTVRFPPPSSQSPAQPDTDNKPAGEGSSRGSSARAGDEHADSQQAEGTSTTATSSSTPTYSNGRRSSEEQAEGSAIHTEGASGRADADPSTSASSNDSVESTKQGEGSGTHTEGGQAEAGQESRSQPEGEPKVERRGRKKAAERAEGAGVGEEVFVASSKAGSRRKQGERGVVQSGA